LRAARANHVFCTDKKRIRTENVVMINTKRSAGGLYKILDCARMCFSSVHNRGSARTGRRSRKKSRSSSTMVKSNESLALFSYKIADCALLPY
jgi:hypothetical protein